MTTEELEDALLAYLAKDDSDEPGFESLTTIYERLPQARQLADDFPEEDLGIDDKERVRIALDQLVADGMAESHWGERDYEASYRVTQDGFYQAVLGPDALVASDETAPETVESAAWTGTKLIYIDSGVLEKIRETAKQLQAASRRANFESKSDEDDIRGLSDALVGLCEMAEPEVDLIDQITSHPKFKKYAAFIIFIATIRGALGL